MPTHRMKCINRLHFQQYLASVLFDSGEGVVVRKPNSEYVRGRSSLLWKLKAVRADMEALVVSDSAQIPNLPDSSLDTDEPTVLLQLPDGTSFRAPWVAGYVPKKGEVVSFSYDSLSRKSIPVRPKILRARADLVWDDLVQDSLKNNKSQVLNESSAKAAKFTTKPMGYWNSEKNNNLRTLFEKFATSKSLNASDPSTWYFLASDMQKNKQFYSVLAPFKGSVVKALLQVFPNIGLKEAKFPILSNRYWRDVKRRREFFLRFAKTNSIDPKNPDHWYSMSVDTLRNTKDSSSVLSFYKGSITRALLHLFPEVNLLSSKLSLVPGIHVNNISAHRKVLENFAQENEFDPLVAVNWFTSEIENKIKSEKGILSILHFYYGNLRKAIGHIFPEIGADKVKHLSPKRKFWDDENNRRQFFVNYAKTKGFDPQDAISWKAVTLSQIREYKSTLAVLEYYNGSLSKALQSLFPQLELQQIRKKIDKYEDENKRKEFFCTVAREYGLDPLSAEAWYSLPFSTIHKRKGSNSVLKYYNGSIWRALAHLFPEIHLDSSRMRSVRVDEDLKTNTDDQDRKIFMDFAKNKNFDPLVVSNWYALDLRELENSKIVEKYGSYIKALAHLFPEIGIIKSRFHHKLTSKYWTYKNNQKEYFISFAKSKSFDPLIADHWYSVSSDEISASKEGNTVLSFYNNNLALALTSLFPEIHFIMSHFPGKIPSGYWAKVESQRDLFVYFAKMKGFDPLIVSNWYSIMSEDFSRLKGASAVLSYYEDSFVQALIHVFSELKFEKHKFQQIPKNHWVVVANRREFFVQYALTKKFDPLSPENWYSVTKESFLSTKKSVSLLNFYKNNLSDALIHLFPEIGLDAKQFRQKWR